jgi:hypothetical protein
MKLDPTVKKILEIAEVFIATIKSVEDKPKKMKQLKKGVK